MIGPNALILTCSTLALMLGCGKSTPAPGPTPIDAVAAAPAAATTTAAVDDVASAAASDVADSAPDAAATADGSATAAMDAPAPDAAAAAVEVEARETAVALLVPFDGHYAVLACWIIPARDASPLQKETPRWAEGDACLPFLAVGAAVHGGNPADGTITAIEGTRIRTSTTGSFLVVAPTGDRRLASTFPTRPGVLESLVGPTPAPTTAPEAPAPTAPGTEPDAPAAPTPDAGAAPVEVDAAAPSTIDVAASTDVAVTDAAKNDAGPAPTDAAPVDPDADKARRIKPSEAQREAVTRAVKRMNGADYPRADITVGDVIWAEVNGDDKLDAILLGSSFDLGGEGHSAGGGAFFGDGRNPARLYDMAVEGQTRFGAPDDTETKDGMETAYWYLPTPEVWETTVRAICAPGGACDRMSLTFY